LITREQRAFNRTFASFTNIARTERKRALADLRFPPRFAAGWLFIVLEFSVTALRAYWKGHLKLSLVSCPIAELQQIGERLTAEWLTRARADGLAIIDTYRRLDSTTQ
jgi:hypothetical protein